MGVALITSVAPNPSRTDAAGKEIGAEYQADCVASWVGAGFEPLSVNSCSEAIEVPVPIATVDRDASGVTGRPHVYIADLLAVARRAAAGAPFALVNADILMQRGTNLAAEVAALQPGRFLFGRRLNISDPSETSGEPFPAGYDFFAGHTDDLAGLETELVFGAPWWDHLLPLAMHRRGCQLKQLHPEVLHLEHVDRWTEEVWEHLGGRFLAEVGASVSSYDAELPRILNRRLRAAVARAHYRDLLIRVSHLNVAFLDGFR